jgi:hypothetical protein
LGSCAEVGSIGSSARRRRIGARADRTKIADDFTEREAWSRGAVQRSDVVMGMGSRGLDCARRYFAMATHRELARFFQLALRLRLADAQAVDRWVDSVITPMGEVSFPWIDLAGASRLSSSRIDQLLGRVDGACELQAVGRIALALVRRHLRAGARTLELAVQSAREIAYAAPLSEQERHRTDGIEDALALASECVFGTLADVRRELEEFLETYAEFDPEIPFSSAHGAA